MRLFIYSAGKRIKKGAYLGCNSGDTLAIWSGRSADSTTNIVNYISLNLKLTGGKCL